METLYSFLVRVVQRIFRAPTPQPRVPAPPLPSPSPLADWDKLLDSMFWAGYHGSVVQREEVFASVDRLHQFARLNITAEARRARGSIDAEIAALREERQSEPAKRAGLQLSLEDSEREHSDALVEIRHTRAGLWPAFADLAAKRLGYREQVLRQRMESEARFAEEVSNLVLKADQSRLNSEINLSAGEWFRRSLSESERKVRVGVADQVLDRIQSILNEQEKRADAARAMGMTLPVSGFLVWAGYLGMASFGWYFGLMVRDAGEDGQGIRAIIASAIRTFASLGFLYSVLLICGVAVFVLVAIPVVLTVYDRIISKFDALWNPSASDPKHRGKIRGGPRRDRGGNRGLSWQVLLSKIAGDVDRRDYRGFMARTPLVVGFSVAVLLCLVFFSLGPEGTEPGAVWTSTFMYFVVGLSFAATLTGLVCLAATVGARRLAAPVTRTHLLVALALLLLLTVSGVQLGSSIAAGWLRLGFAGLLLLLNAVVLAFGLIYRHIHRERARLRVEYGRACDERERLEPSTLLGHADLYPQSLASRWDDLAEKLEVQWKEIDVKLNDDAPIPVVSSDGGGAWRDDALRETKVTALDRLLAARETKELIVARNAYYLALRRAKAARRRRSELVACLNKLDSGQIFAKIRELEGEAEKFGEDALWQLAEIEHRYVNLRAETAAAFRTGADFRQRIEMLGGMIGSNWNGGAA